LGAFRALGVSVARIPGWERPGLVKPGSHWGKTESLVRQERERRATGLGPGSGTETGLLLTTQPASSHWFCCCYTATVQVQAHPETRGSLRLKWGRG
jgi:hypothetical protein